MIRSLVSVPSDLRQECHHLITAVNISYRRGHTRNFPPLYLQYFPHHDDLVLLLVLLASIPGYPDRLTRGRTLGGSLTVRRSIQVYIQTLANKSEIRFITVVITPSQMRPFFGPYNRWHGMSLWPPNPQRRSSRLTCTVTVILSRTISPP